MKSKYVDQWNVNRTLVLLTFIAILNLAFPVFLSFDNHHDGLILTTVHELQDSLRNNGGWPFNQYGQFWAMPFVLISFPFPAYSTLLIIRIVTFIYYLATGWVLFKTGKRFLSRKTALAIVLIFFTAQPFSLGLNSSFLPWPSAFNLLLVATLIERLTSPTIEPRANYLRYWCVGLLIGLSIMTRLQIGALLLIVVLIYLISIKNLKNATSVLAGFFTIHIAVLILFGTRGWISNSYYDSVVFGSNYVRGDSSTYPLPLVTFLLSFCFYACLLMFRYSKSFNSSFRAFQSRHFFFLFLVICFALVLFSVFSSLPLTTWWTLFLRRCWISGSIALISFYLTYRLINLARNRFLEEDSSVPIYENFIAIVCVISSAQIFPLFDQMHFWWAFGPFVLLLPAISNEIGLTGIALRSFPTNAFIALFSVLTVINAGGVFMQISTSDAHLPSSIGSYVYITKEHAAEELLVSNFLVSQVKNGSRVLNLCPNSDIFLGNSTLRSSLREFVLWSPFLNFSRYKKDFLHADFDYLVSCEYVSPLQLPEVELNKSIDYIKNSYETRLLSSLVDRQGRIWKVYIKR